MGDEFSNGNYVSDVLLWPSGKTDIQTDFQRKEELISILHRTPCKSIKNGSPMETVINNDNSSIIKIKNILIPSEDAVFL